MKEWITIEKDITSWLKEYSSDTLTYKSPNQCIIGFPSDGFRSDGMLTDNHTIIALEIEASQKHPDTNVGKYWLLQTYKQYKSIILYHIYTPKYQSYPWRKKLAEFYVSKMKPEVPIEYVVLDYRKASNYFMTLKEIKEIIYKKLVDVFNL